MLTGVSISGHHPNSYPIGVPSFGGKADLVTDQAPYYRLLFTANRIVVGMDRKSPLSCDLSPNRGAC